MSTFKPATDVGAPSEREAMATRLLHAHSPVEVADAMYLGDRHMRDATMLWSTRWPRDIACHPDHPGNAAIVTAAIEMVSQARLGGAPSPQLRILHDNGEQMVAVLYCPDTCLAPAEPATYRFGEVLAIQHMRENVLRLERSEMLQNSLYAISDMAGSDLDMPDMMRGLHRIVSGLMYAENFYVVMYDGESDSLRFLYFADAADTRKPGPAEEIPLSRIEQGLIWYLLREHKPLMGSIEQLRGQVPGPLRVEGTESKDWLGMPMLLDGVVRGALIVLSYLDGLKYTTAEMSLLAFVAEHVVTALERRASHLELEQRVEDRTAELADANFELRREVTERLRNERLQDALYQIAALASSDDTSDSFYRHVHAVIGELINAKNFYVALASEDGHTVSFPYAVDQRNDDWGTRSHARGLTEFVLRTRTPQRVDAARMKILVEAGELDAVTTATPALVWLGVPLLGADRPIGVVAVQSYDEGVELDKRDAELLTFVSYQLASSIQRRKAAERLKQANATLENRVGERTRELRDQISVREKVEAKLHHQVMHDALTGLPNRIYLRDCIERGIARMRRDPSQRLGLLYIDVDRFKVVNDSLGHRAGDEVLREVGRRLSECARGSDVVARLAGDEFAILIEQANPPEDVAKVAQRVLTSLQSPIVLAERKLRLSVSIGIAIADDSNGSADGIVHDADRALYRAKAAGRNRFVIFDASMQDAAIGVLNLEQELRDALINDEFVPYFQPLVHLADGRVVGYEALLRWNHPQRGVLVPGAFLGVAEDSGLIEAIDLRMFQLALDCSRELVREGGYISLNVSPRLFQQKEFDVHLRVLIADSGFDPACLRLEVTEGTLLEDPDVMVATLQRLRDAGIESALDDFGTGYSSLGYVHVFPLRMIKIDRSFISPFSAGVSPRSSAIIEAVLVLGKALDIEILAEGIETEYQLGVLREMGCSYGQGYLFGQPAPARHWLGQSAAARD